MQDRKVVRRRRAVLGLLVGCALILLTAYFGEGSGGGLHAIQRGALAVFSPIESVAADAVKPFRDLINWFGDTFDAKGENKQLKKEVGQLRLQVAQANEKLATSTQLDKIAELDGTRGLTDMGLVNAKVTLANPSVWYSTVNINRGSGDGVHVNDPVINGDGLVGRVIQTVGDASQVLLITDPDGGASAKVARPGPLLPGFVKTGTPGNPNDLLLTRIPRGQTPQVGQMVVTSGVQSAKFPPIFPPSLPIGVITKVDLNELDTSQQVHIKPYANMHTLDVLQVITKPTTRSAGPKP